MCSIKKGVLRNFAKFTGKHLCLSLFFSKVASLRPTTLLKKRLWYRCFPVNFVIFQRTHATFTSLLSGMGQMGKYWSGAGFDQSTYVKSVCFRSCSGSYFPAFRLNMDQNNSEYGHFLRNALCVK